MSFSRNICVPQDAKHEGTLMNVVSDILTVHFFTAGPLVPPRRNTTATAGTHIQTDHYRKRGCGSFARRHTG